MVIANDDSAGLVIRVVVVDADYFGGMDLALMDLLAEALIKYGT